MDAQRVISAIRGIVPEQAANSMHIQVISYFIYKTICSNMMNESSYKFMLSDKYLPVDVIELLAPILTIDAWRKMQDIGMNYDRNIFAAICLMDLNLRPSRGYDNYDISSVSIISLAYSCLDIQADDKVMDLCCGAGKFMSFGYLSNRPANYSGMDKHAMLSMLYRIRCEILGVKSNFIAGDVLEVSDEHKGRYDKVFLEYPFSMRVFQDGCRVLSDWLFVKKAVDLINEDGLVFAVMSPAALFRNVSEDYNLRTYYTIKRMIKSIIVLPDNMDTRTNVSPIIVLFGRNETDYIRYVDARSKCEKGRRTNILSNINIKEIIELLSKDSEISRRVHLKEIEKNDFNLNPNKYLIQEMNIQNGKEFGSIIEKITRGGYLLSASARDKLNCDEDTGIRVVAPKDISEGKIGGNLQSIKRPEGRIDRYLIHDNNIVLSKNGLPVKVAVAKVKEGELLLAHPNLYVIELKKGNNPYYIKAFFESALGEQCLKNIAVGTSVLSLGIDDLKKMKIPVPSIDIQNDIAEKYLLIQDEICMLEQKLKRAKDKIQNLCQEGLK